MGAAASLYREAKQSGGVSDDCLKFISTFLKYCPLNKSGKKLRKAAWRVIDNNGNGYVSLAETGKWIQTTMILECVQEVSTAAHASGKKKKKGQKEAYAASIKAAQDEGARLYKLFYPCYIRAFLDAADIGKNKAVGGTKSATTDDYVQRSEFRYLSVYICIYALMYDAFAVVDGGSAGHTKDDDRRISKDELAAACGKFKGHPLLGVAVLGMPGSYGNVDTLFAEMDGDGKGKVLLNEWCQYLEKQEIDCSTKLGQLLAYGDDKDD